MGEGKMRAPERVHVHVQFDDNPMRILRVVPVPEADGHNNFEAEYVLASRFDQLQSAHGALRAAVSTALQMFDDGRDIEGFTVLRSALLPTAPEAGQDETKCPACKFENEWGNEECPHPVDPRCHACVQARPGGVAEAPPAPSGAFPNGSYEDIADKAYARGRADERAEWEKRWLHVRDPADPAPPPCAACGGSGRLGYGHPNDGDPCPSCTGRVAAEGDESPWPEGGERPAVPPLDLPGLSAGYEDGVEAERARVTAILTRRKEMWRADGAHERWCEASECLDAIESARACRKDGV